MSDFITNGSAVLPPVKSDIRVQTDTTTEWGALDANEVRQALLDVRDEIINIEQAGTGAGSTTPVTANGSTTARTLGARFSDVFNVSDYGTFGTATDTTAAFNAAMTAVGAAGGGLLTAVPGTYSVNGTITGVSNVHVYMPGVTITQTANTTPTFKWASATDVVVEGLSLVGVGSGDTASCATSSAYGGSARAYGLWFDSCSRVTVRSNRIRSHRNAGVVLWHSSDVLVEGNIITGTRGQGGASSDTGIPNGDGTTAQFGIWVVSGYSGDDATTVKGSRITIRDNYAGETAHAYFVGPMYDAVTATGNRFAYLSQHGFYIVPYKNLTVSSNKGTAYGHGIKLQGQWQGYNGNPESISICDNEVTGENAPAIQVAVLDDVSGSTEVRASTLVLGLNITGNVVSSTNHAGMLLASTRTAIVSHNIFRSCAFFGFYAYHFEGRLEGNYFNRVAGATQPPIQIVTSPYDVVTIGRNTIRETNPGTIAYVYCYWDAAISPPRAWAASQYWGLGAYAVSDSGTRVYVVKTAGISASSGGPTGTGTSITDGTVVWDFVVAVASVDKGTVILDGNKIIPTSGSEPTNSLSFNGTNVKLRSNDLSGTAVTIATTGLISLEDDGANIHGGWAAGTPYLGAVAPGRPRREFIYTGAPGSGTFERGDRVLMPNPGAIASWYASAGGSPGTWGFIQGRFRAASSPANGGSVTPDVGAANTFTYTAGAGVASFTINAPGSPTTGQQIAIIVRNNSGGALTITWNAAFKVTWTSPATGNSRTALFEYDGANWIQLRADADIPN